VKLRTKLITIFLVLSLIPGLVIGVAGLQNMQEISDYTKAESTSQLEAQMTSELNSTVTSRQEELGNLLSTREVDATSLSQSAAVQNYHAANQGEMELVQRQSQKQLGYMSLMMLDSIESTKQRVLDAQYNGRSWEDLTPGEQAAVKDRVEELIAGTSGHGTAKSGAFSNTFQPGYIGDTGYFYYTDIDSNIVAHHSLEDGFNLKEDAGGTLVVFDDIKTNIQSTPAIENGETWGIAEYKWEDTTQDGNPVEQKFIAYTYYEDFGWIVAPNVYYYELQTTAVDDARNGIRDSFESYLETRTITVDDMHKPAYDQIEMVDADGNGLIRSYRTADDSVESESITDTSYANSEWFTNVKQLEEGEVAFGEIASTDKGQAMRISTPVYYDDEFVGAISLTFNYDIISTVVTDVTVGESGHLSIVNGDGEYVSHPDNSVVESRKSIDTESYAGGLASVAKSDILPGNTGLTNYERTVDGEAKSFYVAYAPVEVGQKQFRLLATVPREDITDPITTLVQNLDSKTAATRNFFLLLFAGMALAVAGIGYKVSEYISDPIESVRDRAKLLASGQLGDEVETSDREDEIGELLDSFGDMQGNLHAVFDEIDDVSQSLQAGSLEQDIETDYPGAYGNVLAGLSDGVTQLDDSFNEIRVASKGLQRGDLDQQLDDDKPGDYGTVLADLNGAIGQLDDSFTQILRASEGLKAGRLSQEFETDFPGSYGQAMEDLQAGFDGVNESIAQVQEIANTVSSKSGEVSASTAEIGAASEEVAGSVQEISQGADEQSENLQEAASELNTLSATVEEIASSANQVSATAADAVEKGKAGREQASAATSEIEQIETEAEAAVDQVSALDAEMEQISEIVQLIDSVAEQTNLLALNASIEAARAGEAGEGFAVVADEIKALAAEAGEATDEIESRIAEVQSTTTETVDGIEDMKQSVETSADTIDETIQQFDAIAAAIEEVEGGVMEIDDATGEQASSAEEIVVMVDEVSSVAEETAAEASNVSAASEEQTAALSDVGNNVDDLSKTAEELFELVDDFDVADDDVTPGDIDQSGPSETAATDGGQKSSQSDAGEE